MYQPCVINMWSLCVLNQNRTMKQTNKQKTIKGELVGSTTTKVNLEASFKEKAISVQRVNVAMKHTVFGSVQDMSTLRQGKDDDAHQETPVAMLVDREENWGTMT